MIEITNRYQPIVTSRFFLAFFFFSSLSLEFYIDTISFEEDEKEETRERGGGGGG